MSSYLYGPQGRGVISFVGSFYFAASLILSFGLARVAYQIITSGKDVEQRVLTSAVGFVYLMGLLGFAIVLMVYLIWGAAPLMGTVEPIYFLVFFGWFIYNLWLNFSNLLFSSVQRTTEHEKLIFFTRLIQVLSLAVFIFVPVSLKIFLIFYSLTCLFVFLLESFLLIGIKGYVDLLRSKVKILPLFSGAFWPYMDNISQAAYPLVIFIIGLFVSSAELGIYHFALQITSGLTFPFLVIQVKVQEQLVSHDSSSQFQMVKKYIFSSVLLGLPIATIGYFIPSIFPYVGLSSFDDSSLIIRALLISIPLYGVYFVFQGTWVAYHLPRVSFITGAIFSVITAGAAFFLSARYGIWSGPIGTYGALVITAIVNIYFLIRVRRSNGSKAFSAEA